MEKIKEQKAIKKLREVDIISIYLDNYKNPWQKTRCKLPHKYYKLEGEPCYECEKCGSMGGTCWKCGKEVYGKNNKEFCRDCAKEIREFIIEELKKGEGKR